MTMRPLRLAGALQVEPDQHVDERGVFLEWFRADHLARAVGHPVEIAQANLSVSRRGAIRGLHLTGMPPGQAKYVACVSGAVLDVLVDLRLGSPTFGRHETVGLDAAAHRAVYVPEGFGHGFCVLSEEAVVSYLCSAPYAPEREYVINPFDPALGITWPVTDPVPSPAAASARGMRELVAEGLLPAYADCRPARAPGDER